MATVHKLCTSRIHRGRHSTRLDVSRSRSGLRAHLSGMTSIPPADTGPEVNAWYRRLEAATDPEHAAVLERAAGPRGGAPSAGERSAGESDPGGSSLGERTPVEVGEGRRTAPNPDRDVRGHHHPATRDPCWHPVSRLHPVPGRGRPASSRHLHCPDGGACEG